MKTIKEYLGKVSITCNGLWDVQREYDRLCLVHDGFFASYVSRKRVPAETPLTNTEYWQPVANLRDNVKVHAKEFEEKVIQLLAQIQLKLKSARIVVKNIAERDALTINEVVPGCEVYVLETKQSWILDSIVCSSDENNNYKEWHLEVDSKIDSEEKYKLEGQFDTLTADRAICDAYGNIIHDTYITRETIHNYVDSIINDFISNWKYEIQDNTITYDMLSESLKQFIGSNGNITNMADEEDLTVVDNQLKLKDREYKVDEFSGKGYKILRKNWMNNINLLEQSMINEANTVYEVRYLFCLDSRTVKMPANSVLYLNGGQFNNGTIELNETPIRGIYKLSDFGTATITGTFAKGQLLYIDDKEAMCVWSGTEWINIYGVKFRWADDNSIDISYDGGQTWKDLSPVFTNQLAIKDVVASVSNIPSTAVVGDIYSVGPTYASDDAEHIKPIYTLYLVTESGNVNLGSYNSISAGIVQGIGNSENTVMSQKAICDAVGLNDYPTFSASTDYSAGDVVNYQGKLYKFTADHAAGAWTGTDVVEWSLKDEINTPAIPMRIVDIEKAIEQHGNEYPSINFSYAILNVNPNSKILALLPFQAGTFSLAFFNNDEFISSCIYEAYSDYLNMEFPLYKKLIDVPNNCNIIKATIFNKEKRKKGWNSYFYYVDDIPSITIKGCSNNAVNAGIIGDGEIYYNIEKKKFRRRFAGGNVFVDEPVTNNTRIIWDDLIFESIDDFEKGISIKQHDIDYSGISLLKNKTISYLDGKMYDANTLSCSTQYLYCYKAKYLKISLAQSSNDDSVAGMAFYDKDFGYIFGIKSLDFFISKGGIYNIPIPENAVYFRTSYYIDEASQPAFTCKVIYSDYEKIEKLDDSEICNYYGIIVDEQTGYYEKPIGEIYNTTQLGASWYIDCKGASYINISMPVLTTVATQGLVFYNKDKEVINGVLRVRGDEPGIEIVKIYVPDDAVYFRTTYWNSEKTKLYGSFTCEIHFIEKTINEFGIRPYQNDPIYFSAWVEQSVNNYWDNTNSIITQENLEKTTGVLLLPDNYDPNGKPAPIIMYCHGYSHGVYYNTWGATENFLLQKKKWASMGYAVFDCNGARDNNREVHFTGAGSLQFVSAYKRCYDYIRRHYNVENRICVVAGSAGGPTGINFCFNYGNLVKKACLLSAWTDIKICSWEQNVRDTFVEYLGFSNTSNYEEEKTIGYDPVLRIVTFNEIEYLPYFPVPIKAWVGSTEVNSALYKPLYRFINALRKSGITAYIREIDGLTHTEIVSGNNDVVDKEVISWFNL